MRLLLWLTMTLAALYGGYWYVGSRAALSGMEAALDGLKAEGVGDYADVSLKGFPSRFDITIDKPRLLSSDGANGWSADFLQLLALSYHPNQVIAVWPKEQSVRIAGEPLTIRSEDLRASVATEPTLSLPLDHAEVEGHQVEIARAPGLSLTVEKLILAARPSGRGQSSYDLAALLTGLAPGAVLKGLIDPGVTLPAAAEELRLQAAADFDRRIDKATLASPPRLLALREIEGHLGWGDTSLDITGELAADTGGFAEGRIEVKARNWEALFAIAAATGLVPSDQADQIRNILAVMAQGSKDGSLTVPISFEDGMAMVGGAYLGPAPRF
ncbi:DUF2125 domain-containing protein [Frigidibacter sp. RF13]|uniref:DUF2125 domain-containing protein n=1 Tax=Frigidibacter sp. RF13 TaxID=2997340 RepID=UPI0022717967|nr:DUF2125 domain-containing protein [Frigidibacter sp. RF13]MCY1126121.1 DUF2125 domain-containing protein [Frigidibacter sp. RF13]